LRRIHPFLLIFALWRIASAQPILPGKVPLRDSHNCYPYEGRWVDRIDRALATGFPVTVLTWSGVASVSSAYYDVARTLGAKPSFLVLKVAIPAALPHVFVGLFMGLGSSFAVLVVAEMIGVKAGLGWYLQWAQGWAAYANMYAALIVMSLLCSGAITLLFRTRDRLLVWQKGVVKW